MGNKVIYVSLDERNCNYELPYKLGRPAGLDIIRPDASIMSRHKQPCNIEALWEWLYENIRDCSHAILSLDMLVYGSLMCSRHHHMEAEECISLLDRLKTLKEINPEAEIHAFMLIMRTANYDNSSEEPDYWTLYGKKIWKLSWLTDKNSRVGLDECEQKQLEDLNKIIPGEHIEDYVNRRKKNLQVNLQALRLLNENIIDRLIIPKDDNSEFGFSTNDQEVIYGEIARYRLQDRVMVYPGTDEVGCTLVSRVLNRIGRDVPKVYVGYSSTLGPGIIAKYEDRPIHESIKCQIISAGCMMVDSYVHADIILMVNTPGRVMQECTQQGKFDYSYSNFRNLTEFVQRLKYFISIGKICVVADIAYANGADNELMQMLLKDKLLEGIAGYGGWNTAANTLGVVILQGVAAHSMGLRNIKDNYELFSCHITKIIEDWAYQANVLNYFVSEMSGKVGFDCYKLNGYGRMVSDEIINRVNLFIKENLIYNMTVRDISVKNVKLTWNRVFDVEFDICIEV